MGTTAWFGVWVMAALAGSLEDHPVTEFRYEGTLTPAGRKSDGIPVKRFTLDCFYFSQPANAGKLAFLVEEEGGGGWAWPERFGLLELNSQHKATNRAQIRLLHTHDEVKYPIPLRQVIFEYTDKLKIGETWKDGSRKFEVLDQKKIGDRVCWRVRSIARIGRPRIVWVDVNQPVVVKLEETVFMGRGDRFVLKMNLSSQKSADQVRRMKLERPFNVLINLQSKLKRGDGNQKPELSKSQLNQSVAALKTLAGTADSTPLAHLVATVKSDVEKQLKREGSVETLAKKFLGKPAPKFELKSLTGQPIRARERKGKIVVLHFWEYQGKPLVEPYGQVGYLDFLNGKRSKLGVKIYGVAVDSRLARRSTTPEALRSIRKLKSFMNLSYDVAIDDGTLLKKFGDPRTVGAKLPLWVVIGPDGKIEHYKAGFYKIRTDEGLRALDSELIRLIRANRKSR
ncbi:MAG: hypothetical protein Tsb009_22960 [Planctomycetaceae bacterium]